MFLHDTDDLLHLKLFLFGLGQGTLILLAGTFTGFLSKLPRSGQWMDKVKKGFALAVMLAASLMLVYVGQATDFPDLSRIISGAGGAEAPVVRSSDEGPGSAAPALPAPDDGGAGDRDGGFGGDEFLD